MPRGTKVYANRRVSLGHGSPDERGMDTVTQYKEGDEVDLKQHGLADEAVEALVANGYLRTTEKKADAEAAAAGGEDG